ncbi:hypothetical protein AVEN_79355-1 [Araneus ventricosus]|uniref:Uncharacterized protein n=1 Tax=Araneus ventricosus TaxID=182803 RepID=A0A4Y2U4S0_ARAVE|nr:hypothetical protein AVEN_79355-1 [Araneus ventricosus]
MDRTIRHLSKRRANLLNRLGRNHPLSQFTATVFTSLRDLVLGILTSRFEATRGLFWDGPRNFEPRSDDDTWVGTSSPSFHATLTGGRLASTYDLACNRPHTRRIFSGIGFRTWNPPAPKPIPYS